MFSQLELPGLSLGSAVTLTCPGLGFVPTVAALCAVAVVFPTSCCCEGASVLSDSVRPRRRQPPRLPRPWDSPGESTGAGCHYLLQCMTVKGEREVAQPCPTLREPMGCSPPGSSAPGILQARALEWVPLPSPMHDSERWKGSRSAVSDSLRPHGLQPPRLPRPWDSPGESTGVGATAFSALVTYLLSVSNHL